MLLTSLKEALALHQSNHLRRDRLSFGQRLGSLIELNNQVLVNFASNDYLGLTTHPRMKEAAIEAIKRYGVGSGSAQVVSGYSKEHRELEESIAEFTGRSRALVFSTGYLANLGIISALFNENDLLLLDRNDHASIIDAAKLSGAAFKRYLHCQPCSLEKYLQKTNAEKKLIVTEGVFSMEGDIAPLHEIVALSKTYQACLMVDDAHGLGVLGESGRGTLSHFNLSQEEVPLLVASFGKSCGSLGAFVAGNETLIESILQFSRSFICSTAMPPSQAAVNKVALHLLKTEHLSEQLREVIDYFVKMAKEMNLPFLPSETPIQPLIIGKAEKAAYCQQHLLAEGLLVGMMRPPTVPPKTSRLRISLSAHHSKQQIQHLLECLHNLGCGDLG